ncbi:External NADH-ubiquinone oxidoreductase 1 [Penicillium subrubescens]|uniref:External alternative NAD(P)H-ubiquinone oxidoreductase B1, mitochondrial n=1 Tax=Penicillium subrubescens TaxID=1316194 RepID=A0A1Q5UQY2_9EURO|nr:External NADH-ubiquinone oxidoreductase 1 [Penicillium subrubescens]KAJ5880425.1 External NADH-ubiquinone oxidoreductase 1 [Penicillium subrubescens]OKP14888.1 External alternative NAD(P)H-ubiquinone oxidoreductase B1, mitochondrial [Penicillium subrubescens]
MRAAVLRSRPDGPALRSIGSLATSFKASKTALPARFPITRSLNTSSRRPLSQRRSGPTPNVSIPIRSLSDKVAAKVTVKQRPKVLAALYKSFAFCGFFVIGTGVVIVAFFLYDASTYRETPSAEDIPVSELALNPRRGGPKNLPIADFLVGDYDSDSMVQQKDKPRLVILGTGWGSIALLKNLNPGDYHVTVVSPTNYFLFTPMLPSATVGTLGLRSLVEPVRRIIDRVNGHFLKASATDVEFSHKLVEVSQVDQDGNTKNFYLPYDKLVIGVGCVTNPHGVKGLENCNFLKTIDDARKIKNKVLDNMEQACLPTTTDEERRRLLSFVVCGGGPTGVEFAAELFDLLNEDLLHSFPRIVRNEISVHIIQSRTHILNTYDEALSKYAESRFSRDGVEVLTNARVKEVQKDRVLFSQVEDGKTVVKEIPTGFCLWSTGVSRAEICETLSEKLEGQNNKHALETDSHLRVIGAPLGDVYAIGDCSTVQNNVAENIIKFLRTIAWEKGRDPEKVHLTFTEWRDVANRVKKRFPQASNHLRRLDRLFELYDVDHSGTLDYGELSELLHQIDTKLTSLPATAQRANQQGVYLGRKLTKIASALPGLKANEIDYGDLDEAVYKAFKYKHLGSLAYISNAAIFDFGGMSFSGGVIAMYLWRSIYFAESVSFRTRCMLAMDWAKRALFGRDLMSF